MIYNRLYSEIMDEFREAKNRSERIAVLRKYDHERFREFLRLAFNPNVTLLYFINKICVS